MKFVIRTGYTAIPTEVDSTEPPRLLTQSEQQAVKLADRVFDEDDLHRKTSYVTEKVADDDPFVLQLYEGITKGDRASLARGISLVENIHPVKKARAQLLLSKVMEFSQKKMKHSILKRPSFRIGWFHLDTFSHNSAIICHMNLIVQTCYSLII